MKTKIAIGVLVLIVLLQSGIIYSDKQVIRMMAEDHADRHAAQERMEGYERCVAPVDEAHFVNHSNVADWQRARQGCRDFWLQDGRDNMPKASEDRNVRQ
jgi:hypothetical protein